MSASENIESVGPNFTVEGMFEARRRTWCVIEAIAECMRPGISEEEAGTIARRILKEHGLLRGWHQMYIRFGANTMREYGNPSQPGVILQDNDIFFIDIGPVWQQWEGDGGATFTIGNDPEMSRAARDVVTLWNRVHDAWRDRQLTGRELYAFAEAEASAMGWELNLKRMSGHRVSDFPHEHRFAGALSSVDIVPTPHVWILEMHIRHRTRLFGAFYEDLMQPR